ncbi:MAG: class I SAM-dependent methyltransferase, partial [Candidatus Desantisbacteria bacterium]
MLTTDQKEQINKYEKDKLISTIDFDHYSKRNFRHWNSYGFVYNFVQQYFIHPEQKLLDFGCGNGVEALRYARMGYQVYGFDISDQRIENAMILAEKYGLTDKVTFSVQVSENLDYPPDFFDIIVGVDILHHVNVEESVKEISRILKKNGCAIFREPLQTPKRDWIRNSKIVTWLIPHKEEYK